MNAAMTNVQIEDEIEFLHTRRQILIDDFQSFGDEDAMDDARAITGQINQLKRVLFERKKSTH